MDQPMKIALLGFGRWGRNHAATLHRMKCLGMIIDPSPQSLEQAKALYPDVELSTSRDSALRPDIAGVVLATPVESHGPLARFFISARKPVLVEKPLALTLEEGEEIVGLSLRRDVLLQVGHVLEYHPARKEVERLLEEGALGRLLSARMVRTNLGTIRDVEDILFSFAPHDIAFAVRLGHGAPARVSAAGFDLLEHGVADTASLTLEFETPHPFVAHIDVSWLEPCKERRSILVGTQGMLEWNDTAGQKRLVFYKIGEAVGQGGTPQRKVTEKLELPLQAGEPLESELLDFVEAIRARRQPRAHAQSGLDVLRVLYAAKMSMNERRTIKMSEVKTKPYVHPTAIVDEGALVGEGSKIWHFSHVMPGAKIGKDVVLGQNCYVASKAEIGDGCRLQNNISVYDLVILEEEVFVGPSAVFTNVRNPRAFVSRKDEYAVTRVKRGATLGANSTVVCGATVNEYAFIAAGSVVSKDIPAYALAVGVPARVVGFVCRCGDRLSFDEEGNSTCSRCGLRYRKLDKQTIEPLQ